MKADSELTCLFHSLVYRGKHRTFPFQRKVWFLVVRTVLETSIVIGNDMTVIYTGKSRY